MEMFGTDKNINKILNLMNNLRYPGWLGVGLNHVLYLSLFGEMIQFDHNFSMGWNEKLVEYRNDNWHHIDDSWGQLSDSKNPST